MFTLFPLWDFGRDRPRANILPSFCRLSLLPFHTSLLESTFVCAWFDFFQQLELSLPEIRALVFDSRFEDTSGSQLIIQQLRPQYEAPGLVQFFVMRTIIIIPVTEWHSHDRER